MLFLFSWGIWLPDAFLTEYALFPRDTSCKGEKWRLLLPWPTVPETGSTTVLLTVSKLSGSCTVPVYSHYGVVSCLKQYPGLDLESSPKAQTLEDWSVVLCFWELMETGACVWVCVWTPAHRETEVSLSCHSSGVLYLVFCNKVSHRPGIGQSSQVGQRAPETSQSLVLGWHVCSIILAYLSIFN